MAEVKLPHTSWQFPQLKTTIIYRKHTSLLLSHIIYNYQSILHNPKYKKGQDAYTTTNHLHPTHVQPTKTLN